MIVPLPPSWLIRLAVAGVWLYEGLWCKLLGGESRQFQIVEAVPYFGPRAGVVFLKARGAAELGLAVWFSHIAPTGHLDTFLMDLTCLLVTS